MKKCKDDKHTFYTLKDFTEDEIKRRNKLAVAVLEYKAKICKYCGHEELPENKEQKQ